MFKNIQEITFKISSYCNLDCYYCFIKEESKEKVQVFKLENELADFIKILPTSDILELKVTGGESSLVCDDIERAVKAIKKAERYKDIKIYATTITNGYNLEGIIDLMDRGILNPNGCKFSWDGLYSASKSRKVKNNLVSDDYFNNKVKILGASKFNDKMLVRTALTPYTIDSLYDSAKFVLDSGCKKWEYYYLSDCDEYKEKWFQDEFKKQLIKIFELYSKEPFNFYNLDMIYYTEILSEKDDKAKMRNIGCRHLGTSLYVDFNGDLYPCGYFSTDHNYDHGDNKYNIGSIFNSFNEDAVNNFIEEYMNQPMCDWKNCKNMHCFECPALAKFRKGNLQEKLCQACDLRTIERDLFIEMINKELTNKQALALEKEFMNKKIF